MSIFRGISKLYRTILWMVGVMDILNYLYIWKVIRRERNTPNWKKYGINHDWVGRIYFVYSLNPADEGEPDNAKELLVIEGLKKITDGYLDTLGLNEIITLKIVPITGTISYLVILSPIFYQITRPIYILSVLAIITSWYFGWIQGIYEVLSKFIISFI